MSKKIIDAVGNEVSSIKRVEKITPIGSNVLLELLTQQEILNTKITITDTNTAEGSCPQALIVSIGGAVDLTRYDIKEGDRVLIQGTFNPAPDIPGYTRRLVLLEPHNIKAVLS